MHFSFFSEELKSLKSNLVFTGERLNSTTEQIKETTDQVGTALQEALAIFRDIYALNVPTIDVSSIKANAENSTKLVSNLLIFDFLFICLLIR